MSKNQNPKRSSASQAKHDNMVKRVATHLEKHGYHVQADHIDWKNGAPEEVNDFIPDIVAIRHGEKHIMEIETCPTYKDEEHTRPQLTAFARSEITHVIIPSVCIFKGKKYDPIPVMKKRLKKWKIPEVHVGIYNPTHGKPDYDQ